MLKNVLHLCSRFSSNKKIMDINQVRQYWSDFSQEYNRFDFGPQTFYYSFLNMTQVWKATNILEVACGTGKLLPLAVWLKNSQAKYLATDLSPQMVELAKTNLRNNYLKYNSKISYQQWLDEIKISFKVVNAEQPISQPQDQKFDRIICNCVMMLTQDPQKMLKNLYHVAAPGCLMGVSVWGDKYKNNFIMSIRQSIIEAEIQLPEQRSNFYLYNKIDKLAEKCNWQIVLNWQQNALFPVLEPSIQQHYGLFYHQVSKLPEDQQPRVKQILMNKIKALFQKKKGLNFDCQLLVLKKV